MRYIVEPLAHWWVVRDTEADLKDGNNIRDYFFADLPDAKRLAEQQAEKYESGAETPQEWGRSWGGHDDPFPLSA